MIPKIQVKLAKVLLFNHTSSIFLKISNVQYRGSQGTISELQICHFRALTPNHLGDIPWEYKCTKAITFPLANRRMSHFSPSH